MTVESRDIAIRAVPATKCSARDVQVIMLNGIEHPESGIRTISRQQNDLNRGPLNQLVKIQQFLYQMKSHSRLQGLILVFNLVLLISSEAFLLINRMAIGKVEQCSR